MDSRVEVDQPSGVTCHGLSAEMIPRLVSCLHLLTLILTGLTIDPSMAPHRPHNSMYVRRN